MFEAKLETTEKADILHLAGDLAVDTVNALGGLMKVLAEGETRTLIVDMEALEFIDSKGAAFLVGLNFRLKDRAVVVAAVPYIIRKVLSRLFILEQFTIFKTVEEAWQNVRKIEEKRAGAR